MRGFPGASLEPKDRSLGPQWGALRLPRGRDAPDGERESALPLFSPTFTSVSSEPRPATRPDSIFRSPFGGYALHYESYPYIVAVSLFSPFDDSASNGRSRTHRDVEQFHIRQNINSTVSTYNLLVHWDSEALEIRLMSGYLLLAVVLPRPYSYSIQLANDWST